MPKISPSRRESRRRDILEAAQACFAENGFHQTSMADIVLRSGMSRGAVYGYFPSKDDIIEALADDRHQRETTLNAASREAPDPVEALRALIRAYAQALSDPGGEARRRVGVHGWSEALRSGRVRKRVVEGIDVPRVLIADLVERAQRSGAMASDLSADAIARSLIAVFQGFVLQAVWGEDIAVDSCVAVVDRMVLGLALSRPPSAPR